MKILFCCDPLRPNVPDSAYAEEAEAATQNGFAYELFDFDALTAGNVEKALRKIAVQEEQVAVIYRGWMLTPEQYQQFYDGLLERGLKLVNSSVEYSHCHWFPNSYAVIERHTPRSCWTPRHEIQNEKIRETLESFGDCPLIVKDYVKSRKHEWHEACFIPAASDWETLQKVVSRFIELQGENLSGGLVFREFVELKPIGVHPKSQMPLTKEMRRFYWRGELIHQSPYWDNQSDEAMPSTELFADVARKVQSSFFTMDIAQLTDENWIIVELGDAQVAGLPPGVSPHQFYSLLSTHFG